MAVSFKKLLPIKMQPTMWGDLLTAYQIIDSNIRTGVVNPIFDQYTENASNEELIKLGSFLGIKILSIDGYTLTREYLLRQIRTAVLRITTKTSRLAYKYLSYIYNLDNDIYPMMTSSTGNLASKLNTVYDPSSQLSTEVIVTDQEGDNKYYDELVTGWETDDDADSFYTDIDLISDYTIEIYGTPRETGLVEAFTDTDTALTTDGVIINNQGTIINQLTRNMVYSYYHKFLENEEEWLTKYSCLCLKNDADQIHKATEVIYYEPWLKLESSAISGQVSHQTYYNYDFSISGQIHNVYKSGVISNAHWVQFGTGSHWSDISGIPSNISGVQNFSYHIPSTVISGVVSGEIDPYIPSGVGGWNYFYDPTSGQFDIDFIISERNKFTEFTELALLDSTSGCIFYSTFPKVQWHHSMYNNIRININLV